MDEKYPSVKSYQGRDGGTDIAYIKLNDGKSHHCHECPVDNNIILDFDFGDTMIGIEILYPVSNEMFDEIVKQMSRQGVIGEEILRVMNELPK